MVLIVRRENPWAPFVQGLSQGLERYGQMYNTQKALEGMNYSPEKAAAIARMPEYMQKMFIQQGADDTWLKNLGVGSQGAQAQYMPSEQYAPQMVEQPQTEFSQGLKSLINMKKRELAAQTPAQQRASFLDALAGKPLFPSQVEQFAELAPEQMAAPAMMQQMPQGMMQQVPQIPRDMDQYAQGQVQDVPQIPRDLQMAPQRTINDLSSSELAQLIATAPSEQAARRLQPILESKIAQEKRDIEAFKETAKDRKEILEKAKSARQNLQDLERMEELQAEGKLDTPGYAEFLKRSGFDIPALMNEGSEEFNKIAQTFMRDAKTYLGSRISNFELEQFLRTIPSLSQSPEGRKRVIANLKRFNRVSLEYNNAMKQVMAENKGAPTFDLLEKVDDKVEKRMDYLSEQFKKDLNKPVPQGQNRFITALQAGAGSAIGFPGKLVKGVASKFIGGDGGGEE